MSKENKVNSIKIEQGKDNILPELNKSALNEMGIEENKKVSDIIAKLLEDYEVEEEECVEATIKFLTQLEELDFIEGVS